MLTLATMKARVGRRIQKTDSTYAAKIVEFLNSRYDDILMRHPWTQTFKTVTFSAIGDTETVVIPKDVRHIIELHDRVNDISLIPIDPSQASRVYADVQDVSDIPRNYWREEDTIAAQPTAASVLSISSSSASDVTQKIRIWGIAGGQEVTEVKTLTGTTAVLTSNSFTRVDRISKDGDTVGTITITANGGAVTVATISPTEVAPRYPKIHFVKRPNSAIVYNMTYKVQTPPLVNDEDVPILRCSEILIVGAYAETLEEQRQFQKAQLEWAKYETQIERLWQEFEQFSNVVPRMIPHVQMDPIDIPK